MYVRDIKAGSTNSKDEPIILKDTGATALVDGNNLLGIFILWSLNYIFFDENSF
jgi:hypothetical protein